MLHLASPRKEIPGSWKVTKLTVTGTFAAKIVTTWKLGQRFMKCGFSRTSHFDWYRPVQHMFILSNPITSITFYVERKTVFQEIQSP